MPKCIDPVLCYDGPNTRKFRHYSLSSPTFKALHQTVFNCGKCIFCRKRKSVELAMRCVLHASLYDCNSFLTLTYDESREGYHNEFQYSDIQKFKKSLRQDVWRSGKRRIEIFNVHEYGRNGKKHWHLVVFNYYPSDAVIYRSGDNALYTSRQLTHHWPHGFHSVGNVSEASAMYQAQYTQKDFQYSHAGTSLKSHSKHSGIARPYFLKHYKQILRLGYVPFSGRKAPIPRYFLKLAHRHWCHFHDLSAFVATKWRKEPLYRRLEEPSRSIADLYDFHINQRKEFIKTLADEWDLFIEQSLFSQESPDFVLSGENAMHDLQHRTSKGF